MLKVYYTDNLLGQWIEHPMSPVVSNNSAISRPAGRVRQIGDQLIRFTQDCTVTYGYNVSAIQIDSLTKDHYAETKIQHGFSQTTLRDQDYLFELGTMPFNQKGMHHLDFVMLDDDRCIACVDAR